MYVEYVAADNDVVFCRGCKNSVQGFGKEEDDTDNELVVCHSGFSILQLLLMCNLFAIVVFLTYNSFS